MKTYDPGMHTAEHILNATMDGRFGCGRCFSAHIEKKKSKCDYRMDRALTEAEVREVEEQVNTVIAAGIPVTEDFLPREEAAGRFDLTRLPEDAGASVRVIRIGTVDACPCIGRHVASTDRIGRFHITSTRFENGVLRIIYKLAPPEADG